jgi:hypothetical protein
MAPIVSPDYAVTFGVISRITQINIRITQIQLHSSHLLRITEISMESNQQKRGRGRPAKDPGQRLMLRAFRFSPEDSAAIDGRGGVEYLRSLIRNDIHGTSATAAPAPVEQAAPVVEQVEEVADQDVVPEPMSQGEIEQRHVELVKRVKDATAFLPEFGDDRYGVPPDEHRIMAMTNTIEAALPDIFKYIKEANKKNAPKVNKEISLRMAEGAIIGAEFVLGTLLREFAALRAAHERRTGIQWTSNPQE